MQMEWCFLVEEHKLHIIYSRGVLYNLIPNFNYRKNFGAAWNKRFHIEFTEKGLSHHVLNFFFDAYRLYFCPITIYSLNVRFATV